MLPTFQFVVPHIKPMSTNDNQNDQSTYLKNGTALHLLNTQANFLNKIPGLPKLIVHGMGTTKYGMWGKGDIYQIVISKMFEE